MSNKLKRILSLIAFAGIVIFFVVYLRRHWSEFRQIEIKSWWIFAAIFVLTPISFYWQSLILKIVVEPFGIHLKFKEYFGLLCLTLLGNFMIPFSGLGFRAVYLKKINRLSYTNFLTTVLVLWTFDFIIYTVGGLVGLFLLKSRLNVFDWKLTLFFLIVLVLAIIWLLPFRLPKFKNRLIVIINKVLAGRQKIFKHPEIIRRLIYLTVIQSLVTTLIFFLCYRLYGFRINFADSFLANTLGLYSFFIRLVPGNLGIFELAVVYPSKILGLTVAQGLSVSAINRLANIAWTFTLGLLFGYILVRPKRKVKNET